MSEPTLYRKPTDAEMFADEAVWDETGMVPVEPPDDMNDPRLCWVEFDVWRETDCDVREVTE